MRSIQSSSTLRIAELRLGPGWGRLGVTLAPGKTQADAVTGPVRRDLADDLEVIEQWNTAAVVTLVEPHELADLRIQSLGTEVRRRNMEWHHWPIADGCAPSPEFEACWSTKAGMLLSMLERGASVVVHCKGGLGRAGTIAARLLVETGITPAEAIKRVRAVRPGAIETDAQLKWVGRPCQNAMPTGANDLAAIEDRALGALVGLAVGDAVGAALEFARRPRFAVLQGLEGGGPFGLAPGQWTDDTAMALALADALLVDANLNESDLMARFSDWHLRGTYSCTGRCFDIGNTVRVALERWRSLGDPIAGSTDPNSAGNGALMRLAPVAVRHWSSPELLKEIASRQTRTTHGAVEAVDASVYLACVLADLMRGLPLVQALRQEDLHLADRINLIRGGSWRNRTRASIKSDGYVVHSLEAAVWAASRTTSFPSAVLLAANLGEDADTTAAITGQIAGSLYGLSSISAGWLSALAWRDRITDTARNLFRANTASNGDIA